MRRLWLPVLALLLLIGGVVAYFAVRTPRDTFLANAVGPEVDLPALRVPGANCWHEEKWKLLVIRQGRDIEWRLSYDPSDGGPRVRPVDRSRPDDFVEMPLPRGLEQKPELDLTTVVKGLSGVPVGFQPLANRPAVVHLAPPDHLWFHMGGVPRDTFYPVSRLYLAGRRPDGSVATLPFFVDAPRAMFSQMVRHLVMDVHDFRIDHGPDHLLELRILRGADGVRYRWGYYPDVRERSHARWSGGDRTVPDSTVAAAGEGPLLPEMGKFLSAAIPDGKPYRAIVCLETGPGVRPVDVLRAVECGGGDPRILFHLAQAPCATRFWELTAADPFAERAGLLEDIDLAFQDESIVIVNVSSRDARAGNAILVKGDQVDLVEFPPPRPGLTCYLLRPDRRSSWSVCREVLSYLQGTGLKVAVAFDSETEWPERERQLMLLPTPDGASAEQIAAPGDALSEVGLRKLLERRAAGVRYFPFD